VAVAETTPEAGVATAPSKDGATLWQVVGGSEAGGLLVRTERSLGSPLAGGVTEANDTSPACRIAIGSLLKEIELCGTRLHFERLKGEGPESGWVSIRSGRKELVTPVASGRQERILWTYWDQGGVAMPAFNKLCVETWKATNPTWRVEVVDRMTLQRLLKPGDLPPTFNDLQMRQHRADCAKSALLLRYGGIYMDSSIILWQDLLKFTGWKDIEEGTADFVAYYLGSRDYVENYFLGSRAGAPLMKAWHRMHLAYWEARTSASHLDSDPFFKGVKLSAIPAEERSYLVQHACYKKLLDLDIDGFRRLHGNARLHNAAAPDGALWLLTRLCNDAEIQARKVHQKQTVTLIQQKKQAKPNPFQPSWLNHNKASVQKQAMTVAVGVRDSMFHRLLMQDDKPLVDMVEKLDVPLAKFTGHVNCFMQTADRADLLQWETTVRRLLLRALGPTWALPTPAGGRGH